MRAGHFEASDTVLPPEELEFLAEEELITIVPKLSTAEKDDAGRPGYLTLLSGASVRNSRQLAFLMRESLQRSPHAGTYGKFEPNQPVDVPIWLAIELRKRNQCEIKLPPWMTLKELKDVVAKERTDMSSFQPLPFHYIEVRCSCTDTQPLKCPEMPNAAGSPA